MRTHSESATAKARNDLTARHPRQDGLAWYGGDQYEIQCFIVIIAFVCLVFLFTRFAKILSACRQYTGRLYRNRAVFSVLV